MWKVLCRAPAVTVPEARRIDSRPCSVLVELAIVLPVNDVEEVVVNHLALVQGTVRPTAHVEVERVASEVGYRAPDLSGER
ncbi:MAG TPA: hypothetical protein VLH79_01270 [Chthonomonadales bacterium]|nr:hypothetical protein [Chthonomonadales bacterium]